MDDTNHLLQNRYRSIRILASFAGDLLLLSLIALANYAVDRLIFANLELDDSSRIIASTLQWVAGVSTMFVGLSYVAIDIYRSIDVLAEQVRPTAGEYRSHLQSITLIGRIAIACVAILLVVLSGLAVLGPLSVGNDNIAFATAILIGFGFLIGGLLTFVARTRTTRSAEATVQVWADLAQPKERARVAVEALVSYWPESTADPVGAHQRIVTALTEVQDLVDAIGSSRLDREQHDAERKSK